MNAVVSLLMRYFKINFKNQSAVYNTKLYHNNGKRKKNTKSELISKEDTSKSVLHYSHHRYISSLIPLPRKVHQLSIEKPTYSSTNVKPKQ